MDDPVKNSISNKWFILKIVNFFFFSQSNSKHISFWSVSKLGLFFVKKPRYYPLKLFKFVNKNRPKWPGLAPIAAALRPKMLKFFLLFLLSRELSSGSLAPECPEIEFSGAWSLIFFLFGRCRSFSLLHAFAPGSSCEKKPEQFIHCASERAPRC